MFRRVLSRAYRLDPRPFSVRTEDGVRLAGTRVGRTGPAVIFVHGFLGWHRKPRIVAFVEALAGRCVVYTFDLRGHGESEGLCTFGDREYLDVDAVAELARKETDGRLATLGISMGGIAAVRHAAYRGGVDAVMTVSTPARWEGHRSAAVRRIRRLTVSRGGRGMARRLGYRLTDTWSWPEDPEAVVGRIAPIPLILVHGRDDHFFDVEEAWRLYRRAGQPKRLMLARRFGHAEDGLTSEFAELAASRLHEAVGMGTEPGP